MKFYASRKTAPFASFLVCLGLFIQLLGQQYGIGYCDIQPVDVTSQAPSTNSNDNASVPDRNEDKKDPVSESVTAEVAKDVDLKVAETLTDSYQKKFMDVFDMAKASIQKVCPGQASCPPSIKKPAVVLDIDETVLDNRAYFIVQKKYNQTLWDQWLRQAKAPVFPPSLSFFNWVRSKKIHVFLITGRREFLAKPTARNLSSVGIIGYTKLYLKPNDYQLPSAVVYKTKVREGIEKAGFRILANIGDQATDLAGGHGIGFKLPNSIYTIP
jgi:predicted secreted acid phosphatase